MINSCVQHVETEYRSTLLEGNVMLDDTDSVKFLGVHLDRDYLSSKGASGIFPLRSLAQSYKGPDSLIPTHPKSTSATKQYPSHIFIYNLHFKLHKKQLSGVSVIK